MAALLVGAGLIGDARAQGCGAGPDGRVDGYDICGEPVRLPGCCAEVGMECAEGERLPSAASG